MLLLQALPPAAASPKFEPNVVTEITSAAAQPHPKPFEDVLLDEVLTNPVSAGEAVPAIQATGLAPSQPTAMKNQHPRL